MAWQSELVESALVPARGSATAKEWRRFERTLGPIGQRALDALRLTGGERVLDVGCGAGGLALTVAHRITKTGRVVGIDADRAAIGVARARAREQLLSWAMFAVGEPERTELPSSAFDAVVSRFGLSDARDPARALVRIGRTLTPGGRLSALVWRGRDDNLWFELPRAAIAECFDSTLLGAPASFAPADGGRLHELAESAGFRQVLVERLDFGVWAGDDVDEAVEFFFETDGRVLDACLDQKQFERLTSALRRAYTLHSRPDGVWLPSSAWLLTARTEHGAA